jgi:DNA modification methylase
MYTNQEQLWGYYGHTSKATGTSTFDPVLCELMYRWFCPPGGQIVDPFAGGSVRGIVASKLGYKYWGGELREEQVLANREQAKAICVDCEHQPEWVCGDSTETLYCAPDANFIFSCPPYGDLEVYSDSEYDLSNMSMAGFDAAYLQIINLALKKLLPGHLACFVVGDYRDKKTGLLTQFVQRTIEAFNRCGYQLYNDGILINSVGSVPIRVSGQFDGSRKLGRVHQNVLMFAQRVNDGSA